MRSRANALPETALVMSLVLLLLFGVVQMALIDFYQLSADGASFMAASKTVDLKGSGANQSTAQAIANALFSHFALADVTATAGNSASGAPEFETDVVHQLPVIASLPGFSSTVRIQSRTVEAGVAAPVTNEINFCAKNLGAGSIGFLANTVNGVGSTGITPIIQVLSSGTISVSPISLTNHQTELSNLSTAVQNLFSQTSGFQTDLNAAVTPLLGVPVVGTVLQSVLNLVSGVEIHALAGIATNSELSGLSTLVGNLLGTLSLLLGGGTISRITNDVSGIVTQLTTINASQSYLNNLSSLNTLCSS